MPAKSSIARKACSYSNAGLPRTLTGARNDPFISLCDREAQPRREAIRAASRVPARHAAISGFV
jgi:hypothetical protein